MDNELTQTNRVQCRVAFTKHQRLYEDFDKTGDHLLWPSLLHVYAARLFSKLHFSIKKHILHHTLLNADRFSLTLYGSQ